MTENSTVGPAGANKSAYPVSKPANHGVTQDGGSEVDSAGDGNGLAGPAGEYDTFSNAGGGAAGDDVGLNGGDKRTVGVDGNIP